MSRTSYSEVRLHRRCPKAHDYKYGQHLVRKKKKIGLFKGTILHDMLHSHIMAKLDPSEDNPDAWETLEKYADQFKDYFREEREEHGDIIGDCETIFQNYLKFYKKDPIKYEESECFVETELADDLNLIGYLDKVGVDQDKRRWIMDHKFVKSIPTIEDLMTEIQMLIYVWAWNRMHPDRPIDGIIWDFVRTKVPSTPDLLKNGSLSQRKDIDTTYEHYLATIILYGLDPKDYVELLQKLKDKKNTFFTRHKFPTPSDEMMKVILGDFRTSALMIKYSEGICPRSPNQFNCAGCDYKEICMAEVRGHDTKFIKKKYYTKREPRF